jgi:hypothetical protein
MHFMSFESVGSVCPRSVPSRPSSVWILVAAFFVLSASLAGAEQTPAPAPAPAATPAASTTAEDGRTVLFSSHLLDEVEQVADHVTMIRGGRVAHSAAMASIREAHGSLAGAFLAETDAVLPPAEDA